MKNLRIVILASLLLLVVANAANAQSQESDDDKVFVAVEEQPQYHDNGMDGLVKFIGKNLSYPTDARKNNVQGNVYVSFVVEKDGSPSGIVVVKGVEKSLDDEAVRVIKLTKWSPGKQNGKSVRTKMVLPISYKI